MLFSSFLVVFIPLFIPLLSHCGGGCHPGDSRFVLRMWCEHWPSAGYKQVLLSQVIHYKQISYCLCSLGALLLKYTNNRTCSLKLCLSISNYCMPTYSDFYCQHLRAVGDCFRLCARGFFPSSCLRPPRIACAVPGLIHFNVPNGFNEIKMSIQKIFSNQQMFIVD